MKHIKYKVCPNSPKMKERLNYMKSNDTYFTDIYKNVDSIAAEIIHAECYCNLVI